MQDSFFVYGFLVTLALYVTVALSSVVFMRYQGNSAHLMKSAHMMESRVYLAVVEKYGVMPNLVAVCSTPEGETIIGATTRCDRCGSIEECHQFFDQPGRDVDEAREFCPNANLFIELAEELRREAKC